MDFSKKIRKVKKKIEEYGGEKCGEGRTRLVFLRGDVVLKVPKFKEAELENKCERNAYLEAKNKGNEYAACRLVKFCGVKVLMMEKVNEIEIETEWSKKLDDNQVGLNKDGELKAFDYPDDPLYSDEPRNKRSHEEIVRLSLQNSI